MPTFNDLLISWLALKAATAAPDFHTFNWAAGLQGAIESGYEDSQIDHKAVETELEGQLIITIIDGHRTGHWPWTD